MKKKEISKEEREMWKISNLCDKNMKSENERKLNEFKENMFDKTHID